MATFDVQGPDGATYQIDAPDNATDDQVLSFAKSQWDSLKAQKRTNDANAYAGGMRGQRDAKDMGMLERGLGGAKHAWDRAALGIQELMPESVRKAGDWVDEKLGMTPITRQQLAEGKAFVDEAGTAAKVGEFAGDVAVTAAPGTAAYKGVKLGAKFLPKAVQAVAPWLAAGTSGAGVGAAVNPEDRAGGAIAGGVGSVLGEGVGRVLSKTLGGVLASKVTPEARALMDEGVSVPAWKAIGEGPMRNIAERARALPVVGPLMKSQEAAAMRDYNETLIKKATPPTPVFDEAKGVLTWKQPKSDKVGEIGQAGVDNLHKRFNKAYDAVYKNRTIPLDDTLAAQLDEVAKAADSYTPGAAPDINGLIRKVNDTLRAGTETTKTTSKLVDEAGKPFVSETLGHAGVGHQQFSRAIDEANDAATAAWRRGDAEKAEAFGAVRDALQAARERGLPPEVQSMLAPINDAYRNYKLLQKASGAIGAVRNEGVVTPGQVTAAVKALDKTPNKSATTRGIAFGQKEAQRANNVLGNELPDVGPGTAEKMALMTGLAGLGWAAPTAAAGSLFLTRPGQRLLMGGYGPQAGLRSAQEIMADIMRQAAQANAVDRD